MAVASEPGQVVDEIAEHDMTNATGTPRDQHALTPQAPRAAGHIHLARQPLPVNKPALSGRGDSLLAVHVTASVRRLPRPCS